MVQDHEPSGNIDYDAMLLSGRGCERSLQCGQIHRDNTGRMDTKGTHINGLHALARI